MRKLDKSFRNAEAPFVAEHGARSAPGGYDGLDGDLPQWVPQYVQVNFARIRTTLLTWRQDREGHISRDKLAEWISADDCSDAPHEIRAAIHELALIQRFVRLGEEQGLRAFLGEDQAKTYEIGNALRQAQKQRAQKPRNYTPDGQETVNQMIRRLACHRQYVTYSAKELWPVFYSELDQHKMMPNELTHQSGQLRKSAIFYWVYSQEKAITFGRFENVLSQSRANDEFDALVQRVLWLGIEGVDERRTTANARQ